MAERSNNAPELQPSPQRTQSEVWSCFGFYNITLYIYNIIVPTIGTITIYPCSSATTTTASIINTIINYMTYINLNEFLIEQLIDQFINQFILLFVTAGRLPIMH